MTGRHAGEAEPDAVGQQGGAEQAAAPVREAPLIGDPATALRAEDGHLVTGEAVQARESEVRPEAPSGADLEVITGSIDLRHLLDPGAGESASLDHHIARATRRIRATPHEVFAVLQDPTRHHELEAKGMIVEPLTTEPIAAEGQVFSMAMHVDWLGDYIMDNHVTEFEQDRVIAWKPARRGREDERTEPVGFRWRWSLEPAEDGETEATLEYDWLDIENEKFLAKREWPQFPIEHFVASVRALAAAAEGHEAA